MEGPKDRAVKRVQFIKELLSKEVFNTLNAFFYTKYQSAGFMFDYLKCYNVKQYGNVKAHNQAAVNSVLNEARDFLTKNEIAELRVLMEFRRGQTKTDRLKLIENYFDGGKNKRTGKYFKRFLRVFKSGVYFVLRFTSINVDSTLYPIITMIEFRTKARIKVEVDHATGSPDWIQVNELWAIARNETLERARDAIKRKYGNLSRESVSEENMLKEPGFVIAHSLLTEDGDDSGDLINLTDTLASLNADLDAIDEMRDEEEEEEFPMSEGDD